MTIYEKGLVTILVVDAVSILISIPLVLRKIGPNVVYGYRTRATLSDPALWYEANALFGRRLIAACLVSALAALFLARPGLLAPDAFLPVSVVLLGAPVAVAGVMTSRLVARDVPRGRCRGRARPRHLSSTPARARHERAGKGDSSLTWRLPLGAAQGATRQRARNASHANTDTRHRPRWRGSCARR